jgi:hypothetical protein
MVEADVVGVASWSDWLFTKTVVFLLLSLLFYLLCTRNPACRAAANADTFSGAVNALLSMRCFGGGETLLSRAAPRSDDVDDGFDSPFNEASPRLRKSSWGSTGRESLWSEGSGRRSPFGEKTRRSSKSRLDTLSFGKGSFGKADGQLSFGKGKAEGTLSFAKGNDEGL